MSAQPQPIKPRPDLHKVMSGEDADSNCPVMGGFTKIYCEHCRAPYIVHCLECKQQMSQCGCTIDVMTARHREENAHRADEDAWKMEQGLWVPPNRR
jgi:hypothetical protein